MPDYARIIYVTKHYERLQGLRLVPLGIWFLLTAAGLAGRLTGFGTSQPLSGLTLLIVGLLYYLIGRYYASHYGVVNRAKSRPEKIENILILLVLGMLLVDVFWMPPISFFTLGISGLYLYSYFTVGRPYRHYYLILAGLFLVVSFLPLLLSVPLDDTLVGSGGVLFYTVLGGGLIVAGIVDHLMLVRASSLTEEAS